MKRDDFITQYLHKVESIARQVSQEDISKVIELLFKAWKEDRQVFLAGNGGSAPTASHFASDLAKFTSVEGQKRFRAISLVDNVSLISALTNDLGWDNVYSEQLKNLMQKGDIFVAISVHGGSGADVAGLWSQNLLKAAKLIKDNGGKVVGMAGFDGGALKQIADACIVVPIDSTPQVEGFHSVLSHLICDRLRDLIGEL
ncbi:MAG TPA: SIS domain-containing protein [Candidatus Acidoferrum sp.]|nr:SIS domain-containing protein [Candidatus Acidoferrum sp.]